MKFLPPLVTPSDEEPIGTGGWQVGLTKATRGKKLAILPPLVTPSDEEPIGAGGRYF